MDNLDLFERFALAIAIGAVVGVERHWRERDEKAGQRTAGLRTFTLAGMLGGLAAFIEQSVASQGLVLTGMFLVFSAAFALFQYRESITTGNLSVTSVVAAMATFALGALAVTGSQALAAAGGVALVAILASRTMSHAFMRTITWNELRSAIVLLAMTFIILPVVPATPVGPFGGISPSQTWMLAILLAGVSFIGYAAVKAFGTTRGSLVAGAIGGLLSSTGVAVTNARESKGAGEYNSLVAGALAATAVSCSKVAAFCLLLSMPLAARLAPSLFAVAAIMVAGAFLQARQEKPNQTVTSPRNPFDLLSVLKMAALLVVIAFLARAATTWLGNTGLLVVSLISGLADVDAVTVTVTGMTNQIGTETAAQALGAAVISNTIAKSVYALGLGSRAYGGRYALVSAIAIAVGIAVYALIPLLPTSI